METTTDDALQPLTLFKATADAMAAAADSYLDLMRSDPPQPAVIGQFYITYSGSIVYVARRTEPCTCPACTGRPAGVVMIGPIALPLPTAPEPASNPHPDVPTTFLAVVIKGGHGMTEYRGWGPGDTFVVNPNGVARAPEVKGDNPTLTNASLGMIGLSLRRVTVPTWNS